MDQRWTHGPCVRIILNLRSLRRWTGWSRSSTYSDSSSELLKVASARLCLIKNCWWATPWICVKPRIYWLSLGSSTTSHSRRRSCGRPTPRISIEPRVRRVRLGRFCYHDTGTLVRCGIASLIVWRRRRRDSII